MNTFDSQHSLNYGDDILESNPFADTPSRSTELRISTSFSSDNEPPSFEATPVTDKETVAQEPIVREPKEEEEVETLAKQVSAQEEEEHAVEAQEEKEEEQEEPKKALEHDFLNVDKHEGQKVLSPISNINQLDELTLSSPIQQEEPETDTQVYIKKKLSFVPGFIIFFFFSRNRYKYLKVDQDLISK